MCAFMAAAPLIVSAAGTAAGVAGQAGLFGGSDNSAASEATGRNNVVDAAGVQYGLQDYATGQQQLNKYNNLFDQAVNLWQNQTQVQNNQMTDAYNRLSPVANAQANEIMADIGRYAPYKDASIQTGMKALDYMNNQMGLEKELLNDAQTGRKMANRDVEQALQQQMDVYRPMETRMLGRMENEVVPSAQKSWQASQDYFDMMKKGIDPQMWADQASGDVTSQYAQQRAAMQRNRAAMGVDPTSGVAAASDLDMAVNEALQGAGASSKARQAGVLQNRQDYGTGLAALQSGAGQFANTLGNTTQLSQVGAKSNVGLPIAQRVGTYNASQARSMMMDPATSLSADSLLKSYQANPTQFAVPLQQLGSMSMQNSQNLYGALNNVSSGGGGSSADSSGAGYGALAGMGLSGLTNQKNWGALNSGMSSSSPGSSTIPGGTMDMSTAWSSLPY